MTRSIGDFDLKPYGVIATPDISRRSLKHGKDKFLVLMTGMCKLMHKKLNLLLLFNSIQIFV